MIRKLSVCAAMLVTAAVLWPTGDGDRAPVVVSVAALRPTQAGISPAPIPTSEPTPQGSSGPAPRNQEPADPFLTADLRYRLEAVLHDADDAQTPELLKRRVISEVHVHFRTDERLRAGELLERYVDYRTAMGGLVPPADLSDPRAVHALLEAQRRIRERYFDGDEYGALFGAEEELDRFTLARLAIARQVNSRPTCSTRP